MREKNSIYHTLLYHSRKSFYCSLFSCIAFISLDWHCSSPEKNPKAMFESCVRSFSDEEKCHTMIYGDPKVPESTGTGLFLRGELIERLQIQSKSYVRELLGEPDEKIFDGTGRERWIYTRPLTQYSKSSKPDREFTVIIRTERVVRVIYKPPLANSSLFRKQNTIRDHVLGLFQEFPGKESYTF